MNRLGYFSIVCLALMASAAAAMASDGSAEFRIMGGGLTSFVYEADLSSGQITGQITNQGTNTVALSTNRDGSWSGSVGSAGVTGAPAEIQSDGSQTLEVQTTDGTFDYTIETNRNGDLEIRTVSPRGNLLTATLENKGSGFAVGLSHASFQVTEDAENPGHYAGTVVDHSRPDSAYFITQGSLDLRALAQKDRTLFVLLYVLPFDLHN